MGFVHGQFGVCWRAVGEMCSLQCVCFSTLASSAQTLHLTTPSPVHEDLNSPCRRQVLAILAGYISLQQAYDIGNSARQ
jgi:hypothetical protein